MEMKQIEQDMPIVVEAIKSKQLQILEIKNQQLEAEMLLDFEKSKLSREISEALDEKGKKKFNNAEVREVELNLRISGNEGIKSMVVDLKKVETDVQKEEIELHYLENKFKMMRYLVRLFSAEQN